ncbi:MAG: ABC transporter permease [Bryobacteraceae bacterium]
MLHDLRLAARSLLRARGFSAVTILTLGLAMALGVCVLAVVNAYLLKSLPYPGASRLYNIRYSQYGQKLASLDWSALDGVFEHAISWDLDVFFLVGGDHPEPAHGAWVTPGFMAGLGITSAQGRPFAPEEFSPGAPQVALISHGLWKRRFAADPSILGRTFQAYVSDRPDEAEVFTIIGVLPEGFWHVNRYTEVLAPLRAPSYPYMARLKPGVPPEAAARRINALIGRDIAELRLTHGEYVARLRPTLTAVAAAGGMVLVIACANTVFLLLLRAARRGKEIAVRTALGAGRGRIGRMLAAEALLTSAAAALVGIGVTWMLLARLAPVVERQLGRPAPGGMSAIEIDGAVLAGAAAICALSVLLFSLAPLAVAWRAGGVARVMQRGSIAAIGGGRSRFVLIALEVACSLALLYGCGLMVRTVVHMLGVDLGYRTEGVLAATLGLRDRSYPNEAARQALFRRLLPHFAEVAGVERVAAASWPVTAEPRARAVETGNARADAGVIAVSPDFMDALGLRVLEGRAFDTGEPAAGTVIVSRALARRLWPESSAVGRRISESGVWRTVIGVTGDIRQSYADQNLGDIYLPLLESPGRFASIYVRTAGPPEAVLAGLRRAVKEIDPEISLDNARPLAADVARQLEAPRFLAGLLASFSVFAAALALVGVYSLIAHSVRQREHEIAVRMAVGADGRAVTRLFLRQGAVVLAVGIAAGAWGALSIGRMLEAQLHGVEARDTWTLAAVAAGFAASGLCALWWPSRRAARVDPLAALREE